MKKAQRYLVRVNLPEDYAAHVMGGGYWKVIREHNGMVGEVRSLKDGVWVRFEDVHYCVSIPGKWLDRVPYPEKQKKSRKKVNDAAHPV